MGFECLHNIPKICRVNLLSAVLVRGSPGLRCRCPVRREGRKEGRKDSQVDASGCPFDWWEKEDVQASGAEKPVKC